MSFVVRPYQLVNLNLPVTYHDKQRHQWTLHSNASELETKLADLRIAERKLSLSKSFRCGKTRNCAGAKAKTQAGGKRPARHLMMEQLTTLAVAPLKN